jgi:predicted regulator of amino acid metabolism with ACT domain
MPDPKNKNRERAHSASGEELAGLLHHPAADVLLAVLDNPALDESHVCLLLERKDLPGEILEEVARRKALLKSYRVKRALAFHPRTPRLVSLRLLRDLYLMDLVQVAILPGVSAELKRNAEEQLLARLPQLPLGQKITLARRGPARVAGALLAEGHAQIISIVLDNPYMTEAQILRALAREKLPISVIPAIVQHRKWSIIYNVRLALVRQAATPLASVLSYLPELTVSDLRELAAPGIVPENLRKYLQAEVQRRMRASEKAASRTVPAKDPPESDQE